MATAPRTTQDVDDPTSDGRAMAESEVHWQVRVDVVETLRDHFAAEPMVHVGGNLLLFYERGNAHEHVLLDAFVVRGIPKLPPRESYLVWEEGKPPDMVIEITSKTTRQEDQTKRREIYRDLLKITEYFQFDPTGDSLAPSLQGVRWVGDDYVAIEPVDGRLPSAVLGLHLERRGWELRLWDPARGAQLLTPKEQRELARQRAAQEWRRAEREKHRAEREFYRAEREMRRARRERRRAEAAERRRAAELQAALAVQKELQAEYERLRRELEALWGGLDAGQGR
jgi:Uma2 family endonuclease